MREEEAAAAAATEAAAVKGLFIHLHSKTDRETDGFSEAPFVIAWVPEGHGHRLLRSTQIVDCNIARINIGETVERKMPIFEDWMKDEDKIYKRRTYLPFSESQ